MANSNLTMTYLGKGLLAARPVAPVVVGIAFYWVTDFLRLDLWNGSAWSTIDDGSTFASPGPIGSETPSTGAFTTLTATTFNGNTITSGTGTLTLAAGSTLVTAGAFGLTLTASATTNSTLPAGSHTLAGLDVAQTWSAAQTFVNSDLLLLGSSTGKTTFTSDNAGATNYTLHVPAVDGTIAFTKAPTTPAGNYTGTAADDKVFMLDGYTYTHPKTLYKTILVCKISDAGSQVTIQDDTGTPVMEDWIANPPSGANGRRYDARLVWGDGTHIYTTNFAG
jgi:hypothetical protein